MSLTKELVTCHNPPSGGEANLSEDGRAEEGTQATQSKAEKPRRDASDGGWLSRIISMLQALLDEQRSLSRSVRRQRHAQECFLEQVTGQLPEISEVARSAGTSDGARAAGGQGHGLSKAQIEALTRLDQACEHLLRSGRGAVPSSDLQPRTSDEAVAMLQVRVRNLQRSFGLEPIVSEGQSFDDRVHRVHSVCSRSDLADGVVAEEILPGYTLDGQVIRPAVVVVNRRPRS